MAKDLRSFLENVRTNDASQLVEVEREVSSAYEVIGISHLLEEKNLYPIVLYKNVKNLRGEPGSRVLVNLYGDRRRYPIAFGLPKEEWKTAPVHSFIKGMRNPIPPIVVDKKSAPVKEIITREKDADLTDLPIVRHHQEDGGYYITEPILSKDPDTKVYNLSSHRTMNLGKDKNSMLLGPTHTFDNYNKYKSQGKPCPIAHVIGHHPLLGWAANSRISREYSEIDMAGGLLGEPVRMVPSETWGQEFLVPADAEIVIEEEIVPDQMVDEGPFGDWTGYISSGRKAHLAKVRAITRRRDAMLVTEPMGKCGIWGLCALPNEALYLHKVQQINPHVQAIHFPRSGNGFAICYVSLAKTGLSSEGEQKSVALHLSYGWAKLIVVVDEDVDIFSEEDVLRAVAFRCQASLDVDVIRGVRGSILIPSLTQPNTHDVTIIDATWKMTRLVPQKSSLPEEVLNHIREALK